MLLRYGADINQQTKSGDTPCHLAAYRGFSILVQMLAENGASLRMVNNKYRTPLEDAQNQGHTSIVRYLSAVSQIRKYLYSVASNGEGGGGWKRLSRDSFRMLLIILKNVQIFYFLSLFVFHRFWISVPLHEDRLGIPNHCFHANDATVSRRPCFRILLWREFPKSLCSIRKQPLSFIAQRATFSADFPESLTFWLLHIFPDIRRAITWRALAFRLDRYWIYSYSILQNKDVNRNMIGGFFSLRFISWSWRCFAAEQYITENWLFDEISACPCQRLSLSNTQHRDSH